LIEMTVEPALRSGVHERTESDAILAIRWEQAQPLAMSERTSRQQVERERLSEALRENLRRRKAQARGRKKGDELGRDEGPAATGTTSQHPDKPHDSAGIGEKK
jgi:hypothetical protein